LIRQTKEGLWIIDGDQHASLWVERTGRLDHDQYILPLVWPHIKPGSIVVDCGAQIGSHTICYLDGVGPTGSVYAFEPCRESFECLQRNCPRAVCINKALGKIGSSRAFLRNVAGAPGTNYLCDDEIIPSQAGVMEMVEVTSLDSTAIPREMNERKISFIKIDCEGSEPEVILGAAMTIAWQSPVMLVELNPGALARREHTPDKLREILESLGYRIEFLPPNSNWDSYQCDLLCFPKD